MASIDDFATISVGSIRKETPQESASREHLEELFNEDNTRYMAEEIDFAALAQNIGLTREQITGLMNFDNGRGADESMSSYHSALRREARKLGITVDQTEKLVEHDRVNNWG